eukprot:828670-Lingulodinium_polyedra.AAC.1
MLEEASALDPWWEGGTLWANGSPGSEDLLPRLFGVVLCLSKWRAFTTSRWCAMAPSCRAMVCSIAVGLDELVA